MVSYEEHAQATSGGSYAHAIHLIPQVYMMVIPLSERLIIKVAEEIRGDVLFECEDKKLLEYSTWAENLCRPRPEYGKTVYERDNYA